MKLLISFLLSIILLASNLYASEITRDDFIKKSKENTQQITPKLSNDEIKDLIKKLPRENSVTQSNSYKDWFQKLRPFIVPLLIVLYLIFKSDSKSEDRPKKNTKTKNKRSRSEEFVKKHNEDYKITDKDYEDEWSYDQQELDTLQIKVERQQVENFKVFDVMAFGMLGFTKDQIDQTKLEDGEAKFTCIDGSTYEGSYMNNKRHGKGVDEDTAGNRFEGTFKNGDPVQGIMSYAEGDVYKGEFSKDWSRHGRGKYICIDTGTIQDGLWVDDEFQGPMK